MSDRQRLPNRRPHESISIEHHGIMYMAGIGRFPDGRIAEIFLSTSKVGTAVDTQARDAAILASFALQFGAPADDLRRALTRNADGSACGLVGRLLDQLAADGGTP
jgi:ribonucleoside-diphosphate reductase alpha chain